MSVYLRAKFQVSNIILKSFRQGVILPPSRARAHTHTHTHTSKQTPKKPTQIRVNSDTLKKCYVTNVYSDLKFRV